MNRKTTLAHMRIAGYHGDSATFTRLLIENNVGRDAADAEFSRGASMKKAGVTCTCTTCNPTKKGNRNGARA